MKSSASLSPEWRRWIVVAAVLVGCGVWIASSREGQVPVHFWLREGEHPQALYSAPGGTAIQAWGRVERLGAGEMVFVRNAEGRIVDWVRGVTRRGRGERGWYAVEWGRSAMQPEWREYVIWDDGKTELFERAVPDRMLAGSWVMEPGSLPAQQFALGEDGRAKRVHELEGSNDGLRWGRICDLLVISEVASSPGGRVKRTLLVLDPESTTARDRFGHVYRFADRRDR